MGAVSVRVLTPAVSAVIDLVSENLCGNQTTRLSPVGWTCRYDDNLQDNYPPWKSPPRHVGSVPRLGGVWRMIALHLGTFMMCHSARRKHPVRPVGRLHSWMHLSVLCSLRTHSCVVCRAMLVQVPLRVTQGSFCVRRGAFQWTDCLGTLRECMGLWLATAGP